MASEMTSSLAINSMNKPPNRPDVISVSQLNFQVTQLLEKQIPLCWIGGEVSNFTRAASGHWYFTLKDKDAQVRAVMFRGRAQYAPFLPREGDKLEVRATVSLYAPRGDYQINVEAIRRAGVGDLFEAFLRLKDKLGAEGCFDPARKKPIPRFVRTIGIITSPQAAALRDVLSALARRAPHVAVVLYPSPVQGAGSGEKLTQALKLAVARNECEVLLLCRGGGSIEDLWAFNEEVLARAILASTIPVISGVGHETDFTIADFCADLRAATPTAAAELAALPRTDWLAALQGLAHAMTRANQRKLNQLQQRLDWATRRLPSPALLISRERLRLNTLSQRLRQARLAPQQQARQALQQLHARLQNQMLKNPQHQAWRNQLQQYQQAMQHALAMQQQQRRQALHALASQLELLNPQRTLERGYAIVRDASGQVVRHPGQLRPGEVLQLRLAEGSAAVGLASVQSSLE
jgi:exodeoxyribonuclease VII large subunit